MLSKTCRLCAHRLSRHTSRLVDGRYENRYACAACPCVLEFFRADDPEALRSDRG